MAGTERDRWGAPPTGARGVRAAVPVWSAPAGGGGVRTFGAVRAKEAGVTEEDGDRLGWGGLLHDIGKLAVPEAILNKPDRPDEQEWATLRRHPEGGAQIVEPLHAWLGPWAGSVGEHHERWDGEGYPQGLAAEGISPGGRLPANAAPPRVLGAH